MGAKWYAGYVEYEDCDHCGLSFRTGGPLQANHEDGSCVSVFGTKEAKYGESTEASTWRTLGLKVSIVGPNLDSTSRRVMEAPTPAPGPDPVETGWA